ncbi:hypothetical protein F511_27566 [Dorcoceras hygrometricum]|uniref:Uncharacterized protein n=1 Tax=Dorcoceras hygrometricum TaxID=472368 RepID=A0A2Z7AV35_9LAMI|nr:hypothetical protein F511_27566 [Dorcoceras hygrometricum]
MISLAGNRFDHGTSVAASRTTSRITASPIQSEQHPDLTSIADYLESSPDATNHHISTIFSVLDAAQARSTSLMAKLEDFHSKRHQEEKMEQEDLTIHAQIEEFTVEYDANEDEVRRLGRPSQGSVVFRHDDSAGHHIKNNIGPFRRDDSACRSQCAKEFSSQRKLGSIWAQQPAQVYCPRNFSTNSTEATNCSNPNLLKNRRTTSQQSRRHTNTTTASCSSIPATPVSKLVSIESPREYELSATNLSPNGGVKRRQSTEIGFR